MEKKNIENKIIVGLLVCIALTLFLGRIGILEFKNFLPGKNKADVFDIKIDCTCEDESTCESTSNLPTFNDNTDINKIDDDEVDEVIGKVYVDDINGDYVYQNNLKIFENVYYNYQNKIAPGVHGTYDFKVHNDNPVALKYNIKMTEINNCNVNMKYRLKKEGTYIIGGNDKWVSADELKTKFYKIAPQKADSYSLDWKWEYEDNIDKTDTNAGKNAKSNYKLNIAVYFEMA